jgi:hypothetical protein
MEFAESLHEGEPARAGQESQVLFYPTLQKWPLHLRSLARIFCVLRSRHGLTFAVCSFTMAELFTLQKAPIRASLTRLGLNRNISRDIAFGSAMHGGLGLLNLSIEQGIAQIQLLLRHIRAETTRPSSDWPLLVASCRRCIQLTVGKYKRQHLLC